MGDQGRLYVNDDVVPAYKKVIRYADLILPNQFEAEYVSTRGLRDYTNMMKSPLRNRNHHTKHPRRSNHHHPQNLLHSPYHHHLGATLQALATIHSIIIT